MSATTTATDAGTGPPETGVGGRRIPQWRHLVELFALCGFALTQPLLDIFGRGTSQFIFRGAEGTDIVLFALAVTFVPALTLWTLESLVGAISPRARELLHLGFVALLVAAFTLQLGRSLLGDVLGGALLWAIAVALGVGAAMLRERAPAARLWLSYAAVAPLAFLGLFLLASDAARLIGAEDPRAVEAGIDDPAPVVMLVFDELPLSAMIDGAGQIDAELYPNMAELAGDSTWYRNTTSVSSSTWHAMPSVVTGRYPTDGTAPVAADHPESLFTLLGDVYDMNVTESVTRLCPTTVCDSAERPPGERRALLGDAVDLMRTRLSWSGDQGDPVAGMVEGPAEVEPPAEGIDDGDGEAGEGGFEDFLLDQPQRFRSLIDDLAGGTTLNYLHILLPHVPYRYLPSGLQYPGPNPDLGRIGDDWAEEPWLATMGFQRLHLQLGYVDLLVGELLEQLRERGLYDESLIILTSDHGISFRPGGPIRAIEGQSLDDANVGELAWVPLFIRFPGQDGGSVSDANVELVDVLPTIADVLGIELPWQVDGRSVLGPPRPDDRKTFYSSQVTSFGVSPMPPVELISEREWPGVLANATDVVLPATGTPDRFFRIGPRDEWLGNSIDELPPGSNERVDVQLDDAAAFEDVAFATGRVPALIRGTLPDGAAAGDLAITVNGVIAATAPTYDDGVLRFAAMVPGERFVDGRNDIAVYRIP